MRRRADGWTLSGVGVACLPFRLAPLFDKGDGEGGGANEGGRLGLLGGVVGEGGLLAANWLGRDVRMRCVSDETIRNDGADKIRRFRCPMTAVSFISYSFLFFIAIPLLLGSFRSGCLLACLV